MAVETAASEALRFGPSNTRISTKRVSGTTMFCSSCGERKFADFGEMVVKSNVIKEAHERGIKCDKCQGALIDADAVENSRIYGWTKRPIAESFGGFDPAVDTPKYGHITPQASYYKPKAKKLYFHG